jgi:hypothetical protein
MRAIDADEVIDYRHAGSEVQGTVHAHLRAPRQFLFATGMAPLGVGRRSDCYAPGPFVCVAASLDL